MEELDFIFWVWLRLMLDIFIIGAGWLIVTYIVVRLAMLFWGFIKDMMNTRALKKLDCLLNVGLRETMEIRKARYLRGNDWFYHISVC